MQRCPYELLFGSSHTMPRLGTVEKGAVDSIPPDHPLCSTSEEEVALRSFWEGLPCEDRTRLLRVEKRALFQQIRSQYCSRCYGLFQLRYEELRCSSTLQCPACHQCYAGLNVAEDGAVTGEYAMVKYHPFAAFSEAHARERERELQFMTGDICGSGWQKRPGQTVCKLHTSAIPVEALMEYWLNIPQMHRDSLFSMSEEDFVAELDAHMKYQLKICKECRSNVMKAFKELKPGRDGSQPFLDLFDSHELKIMEGLVVVDGPGSLAFFEKAEEIQEHKTFQSVGGPDYDGVDHVRHAETPELAREALQDSAILIFKAQVEVAFREQTAGHNALILFVHLVLKMMEQQIMVAFKELRVKQAEAELLKLIDEDERKAKKKEKEKAKKKRKKAQRQDSDGSGVRSGTLAITVEPPSTVIEVSVAEEEGATTSSPTHRHAASVSSVDVQPTAKSETSLEEDLSHSMCSTSMSTAESDKADMESRSESDSMVLESMDDKLEEKGAVVEENHVEADLKETSSCHSFNDCDAVSSVIVQVLSSPKVEVLEVPPPPCAPRPLPCEFDGKPNRKTNLGAAYSELSPPPPPPPPASPFSCAPAVATGTPQRCGDKLARTMSRQDSDVAKKSEPKLRRTFSEGVPPAPPRDHWGPLPTYLKLEGGKIHKDGSVGDLRYPTSVPPPPPSILEPALLSPLKGPPPSGHRGSPIVRPRMNPPLDITPPSGNSGQKRFMRQDCGGPYGAPPSPPLGPCPPPPPSPRALTLPGPLLVPQQPPPPPPPPQKPPHLLGSLSPAKCISANPPAPGCNHGHVPVPALCPPPQPPPPPRFKMASNPVPAPPVRPSPGRPPHSPRGQPLPPPIMAPPCYPPPPPPPRRSVDMGDSIAGAALGTWQEGPLCATSGVGPSVLPPVMNGLQGSSCWGPLDQYGGGPPRDPPGLYQDGRAPYGNTPLSSVKTPYVPPPRNINNSTEVAPGPDEGLTLNGQVYARARREGAGKLEGAGPASHIWAKDHLQDLGSPSWTPGLELKAPNRDDVHRMKSDVRELVQGSRGDNEGLEGTRSLHGRDHFSLFTKFPLSTGTSPHVSEDKRGKSPLKSSVGEECTPMYQLFGSSGGSAMFQPFTSKYVSALSI